MKKAAAVALVASKITAIVDDTDVIDSFAAVINEVWNTPVTDSNITQTFTTKHTVAGVTYILTMNKKGTTVHINLEFTNTTVGFRGNENLLTWKANEYKPEVASKRVIATCINNMAYVCSLVIDGTKIYINQAIIPGTYIADFYFNTLE